MNLLCHVPNNLHGNSTITTTTQHHINYKEANLLWAIFLWFKHPHHININTSASPATGKYPILISPVIF